MSSNVKQILHWMGSLLALSSIIFVILRLSNYSSQIDFSRFDSLFWLTVTVYVAIYAVANIMLALAWWYLLNYFETITSRAWAIKTYGLAQLAKYVPGNIMHLASRQLMGMASGIKGWVLAKTSVWEIALISFTGAFFFILLLPKFFPGLTAHFLVIIFVIVIILVMIALKYYADITILCAFGCYFLFLVCSGMIFVGLLVLINGDIQVTPIQSITLCAAFIVALLVGLVTPGAPAGVGVREVILIILLADLIPESDLLLAILLSRIVTVGGDICFFMGASLLSKGQVPS